jgi:hypothetical protein
VLHPRGRLSARPAESGHSYAPVRSADDDDRRGPSTAAEITRFGPQEVRRLGFQKEWEHQFEPGFPLFVSIARGRIRLYLSEHSGDAPPNTLIHLYINDVDAGSEEFGIPFDEEGLAGRELPDLKDPDGNRLRIATRRS